MVINAFKDKIFSLSNPNDYPMCHEESIEGDSEEEDELIDSRLYKEISVIDNKETMN